MKKCVFYTLCLLSMYSKMSCHFVFDIIQSIINILFFVTIRFIFNYGGLRTTTRILYRFEDFLKILCTLLFYSRLQYNACCIQFCFRKKGIHYFVFIYKKNLQTCEIFAGFFLSKIKRKSSAPYYFIIILIFFYGNCAIKLFKIYE